MRKAKYLKTGETVNVHNIDYCGQGMDVALIEKDGLMRNVSLYDIQFIDSIDEEKVNILTSEIDWEERRYQISKEVVSKLCVSMEVGQHSNNKGIDVMAAAKLSIDITDELIKQLKNNDLCTISNKSLFFTNTENGLHAPLFTSYYGLEDSNTTSVI